MILKITVNGNKTASNRPSSFTQQLFH
uniref:Uncharacterized protein n=1 Tax=Arundo donax TaxID=35708 RepID=A0A0A8YXA3_ARUDO